MTRRGLMISAFATAMLAACRAGHESEGSPPEAGFPVTIKHKYGETTIQSRPKRVATVTVADHDFLLALGVAPVGIRDWYGNKPYGVWSWAQAALGDAQPAVYSGPIDFEQIVSLQPDLIIGIRNGVTEDEYRLLSGIAPTIVQPAEFAGQVTPWREIFKLVAAFCAHSTRAERSSPTTY
ncbi:MAG: ABC transporter substrate-binding protein [Dehalococcoidia bacterium]